MWIVSPVARFPRVRLAGNLRSVLTTSRWRLVVALSDMFPLGSKPAPWLLPNLRLIVLYICYEFNQKINKLSSLSLQFLYVRFGG